MLYRNWPKLDTTRSLRPYLFAVAFRILSAYLRRRVRETPFAALDTTDSALDPEATLESKQATSLLLAALERVPSARRAVLVMHDLDEVPIADVARRLSMTRFGTYARLRKGRRELGSALRRLLGSPRRAGSPAQRSRS